MRKTAIPQAQPECEIIPIYFEVDDKVVSIVESDGSRTPIFPSERIGGMNTSAGRLRTAIITVMEDMEPEDNGIC